MDKQQPVRIKIGFVNRKKQKVVVDFAPPHPDASPEVANRIISTQNAAVMFVMGIIVRIVGTLVASCGLLSGLSRHYLTVIIGLGIFFIGHYMTVVGNRIITNQNKELLDTP